MTDEEWESSLVYYQSKCHQTDLSFKIAKQEIEQLY
jgi:hypothetical protein